jgi:hypothetical protein
MRRLNERMRCRMRGDALLVHNLTPDFGVTSKAPLSTSVIVSITFSKLRLDFQFETIALN